MYSLVGIFLSWTLFRAYFKALGFLCDISNRNKEVVLCFLPAFAQKAKDNQKSQMVCKRYVTST